VHQGGEEVLVAFAGSLVQLGSLVRQALVQGLLSLLLLLPLGTVVTEGASGEALLAHSLHDVVTLRLVADDSDDSVVTVLRVDSRKLPDCTWHDSRWNSVLSLLINLSLHASSDVGCSLVCECLVKLDLLALSDGVDE